MDLKKCSNQYMNSKLFYLIICLFILACHKDSDTIIREEENPDPPEVIVTTRLVTLADTSISGYDDATQTFSNQIVQFDNLPYQQVQGVGINRDYELVRLTTKEGFDLYHVQTLLENDINYLHWTYPEILHFSGDATQSATYTISTNASLRIPENAVVDGSGQVFQGAYDVYVSFIDPSKESSLAIPSYTGIQKDGQKVSLAMQACYYVSVLTPDKQQLSFQNGAIISGETLSGDAWYFDPLKANWTLHREEGDIEEMEIPLKNTGYYALAQKTSLIRLQGTLQINARTAPHYPITFLYNDQVRKVFTTNSGKWAIHVPTNADITARIELPCDQDKEINIATNEGNDQLVSLQVDAGEIINAHITGTARDCQGQPLTDHVVMITSGNNQFLFQNSADMSFNVVSCLGQMIGVSTLNLSNNEYGPEILWPVASEMDVSSTFGCELAQVEYLRLNIEGQQKMYWDLKTSITPEDRVLIENGPNETELALQLYITGMVEGAYEDTRLNIAFEDQAFGNKGYSLYCPTSSVGCGFTEFKITHFPDQAGEWIRGQFKGDFWIKSFHPLTAGYRMMEGEFQVYRDF